MSVIFARGQVGPNSLADGSSNALRLARNGSLVVGHGLGRYEELARRGVLFTASNAAAGVTMAASHVSPLTAGTGTPIVGLFNAAGSNYDLVVMRAILSTVSGTPGGPFAWNMVTNPTGITATPTQALRNDSGLLDGPACVFASAALTGSKTGVMFRSVGGPTAVAATGANLSVQEETAGDLIVSPNQCLALCATAAGTNHVVCASITFALRIYNGP